MEFGMHVKKKKKRLVHASPLYNSEQLGESGSYNSQAEVRRNKGSGRAS